MSNFSIVLLEYLHLTVFDPWGFILLGEHHIDFLLYSSAIFIYFISEIKLQKCIYKQLMCSCQRVMFNPMGDSRSMHAKKNCNHSLWGPQTAWPVGKKKCLFIHNSYSFSSGRLYFFYIHLGRPLLHDLNIKLIVNVFSF